MADRAPPAKRATRDVPAPVLGLVRAYVRTVESALIAGTVAIVAISALQVFFRYAIGQSLSWSEEALRYLMLWIAFLGMGLAYSRGEMVGMELLVSRLPRRAAGVVRAGARVAVLAMMLAIVAYGIEFAWTTRTTSAVALGVSMFWVHVSVAVGAALVALHVLAAGAAGALGLRVPPAGAPSAPAPGAGRAG